MSLMDLNGFPSDNNNDADKYICDDTSEEEAETGWAFNAL